MQRWLMTLVLLALPELLMAAEPYTMILDWFPNADHVPLFVARDKGFFKQHGLEIELVPPADPNAPLRLVASGRAPFAVNYQTGLTLARAEGLKVKSIGILVKDPLSAVAYLKKSGIQGPADLKGKKIAFTASEVVLAMLRSVTRSAGLVEGDYEPVNVNFQATSALLTGRVDAAIGVIWNYEVPEIEMEGHEAGYFTYQQFGVPDFYQFILITNDDFLAQNRDAATRLVMAVQAAIDYTRQNPDEAFATYLAANPEVRKELDRRAFQMVLPHYATSQTQSEQKWAEFARWALQEKIIKAAVPATEMFSNIVPTASPR